MKPRRPWTMTRSAVPASWAEAVGAATTTAARASAANERNCSRRFIVSPCPASSHAVGLVEADGDCRAGSVEQMAIVWTVGGKRSPAMGISPPGARSVGDAPRCAVRGCQGGDRAIGRVRRGVHSVLGDRGGSGCSSTTVAAVGPAAWPPQPAWMPSRSCGSAQRHGRAPRRGPRALHRRDHPVDGLHPGRRPGARGAPLVDSRAGRPEHRGRRCSTTERSSRRPTCSPPRSPRSSCCVAGGRDALRRRDHRSTRGAAGADDGQGRRQRGDPLRGPQRIGLPVRWCLGCARRRGRRRGRAGAGALHGRRAGRRAGAAGAGRGGRSGADGARRHRRPARGGGAAPGRRRAHRDADRAPAPDVPGLGHEPGHPRGSLVDGRRYEAAVDLPSDAAAAGSEASGSGASQGVPPAEANGPPEDLRPVQTPAPAPVRRSPASGSTGSAGSGGDDRSRSFLFSIAAALAAIAILGVGLTINRRERRARRRGAALFVGEAVDGPTNEALPRSGPTPPSRRSRSSRQPRRRCRSVGTSQSSPTSPPQRWDRSTSRPRPGRRSRRRRSRSRSRSRSSRRRRSPTRQEFDAQEPDAQEPGYREPVRARRGIDRRARRGRTRRPSRRQRAPVRPARPSVPARRVPLTRPRSTTCSSGPRGRHRPHVGRVAVRHGPAGAAGSARRRPARGAGRAVRRRRTARPGHDGGGRAPWPGARRPLAAERRARRCPCATPAAASTASGCCRTCAVVHRPNVPLWSLRYVPGQLFLTAATTMVPPSGPALVSHARCCWSSSTTSTASGAGSGRCGSIVTAPRPTSRTTSCRSSSTRPASRCRPRT